MRHDDYNEQIEEQQDNRNGFWRNLLFLDFISEGDVLGIFK